jgi:hypothetical protein
VTRGLAAFLLQDQSASGRKKSGGDSGHVFSGESLFLGHEGGCVVFVVLFMVFGLFVRWNIRGFQLGARIDIGRS